MAKNVKKEEKQEVEETKEEKHQNKHEVEVKIEGKEWEDALNEVFLKRQKTVKVDGFRKGKVPRNIYEKSH